MPAGGSMDLRHRLTGLLDTIQQIETRGKQPSTKGPTTCMDGLHF